MNWQQKKPEVTEFMEKNYPPNFTYQDFGAQLTTEFFNASKFADIVINSGAKYVHKYKLHKLVLFIFSSAFAGTLFLRPSIMMVTQISIQVTHLDGIACRLDQKRTS